MSSCCGHCCRKWVGVLKRRNDNFYLNTELDRMAQVLISYLKNWLNSTFSNDLDSTVPFSQWCICEEIVDDSNYSRPTLSCENSILLPKDTFTANGLTLPELLSQIKCYAKYWIPSSSLNSFIIIPPISMFHCTRRCFFIIINTIYLIVNSFLLFYFNFWPKTVYFEFQIKDEFENSPSSYRNVYKDEKNNEMKLIKVIITLKIKS